MAPAIAIEDIVAAAERIAPWIRRTPMMSSSHLDRLAER